MVVYGIKIVRTLEIPFYMPCFGEHIEHEILKGKNGKCHIGDSREVSVYHWEGFIFRFELHLT